jgi:hypothetical protein
MREHVRTAARRRDDRLTSIRKLTLWITGGAAVASLGLGTAFAQSLPGHSGGAASPRVSARPAASAGPGDHARKHRHRDSLTAPGRAPARAPAPTQAPVTSGGS